MSREKQVFAFGICVHAQFAHSSSFLLILVEHIMHVVTRIWPEMAGIERRWLVAIFLPVIDCISQSMNPNENQD